QRLPVQHIIRAANRKSLGTIQQEIRAAQEEKNPQMLTGRPLPRWAQAALVRGQPLWLVLPTSIRRFVFAWMLRNPHRRKRFTGTVLVTAVSMFGHGTGWGITRTAWTLGLIVGGLARRVQNMDHDLIDGAPTARFIKRLTDLIE